MEARHTMRGKGWSRGFTLVELLVVISIIIIVTGISVPLMNKYFENQRLPRAARVLATHVRNAQITAMNYLMEVQIEIAPGTENRVRVWGYSAQVKDPSTWDAGPTMMISESRRLSKRGGVVRLLPLNPYSYQPENSQDYKVLAGWEFAELKYVSYTMQACYRRVYDLDTTDEWREWEVTPQLNNLMYVHTNNARSTGVGISRPVGVQVLLSSSSLPAGTRVDTVNYVTYYDANRDGMPDGNPLALRIDSSGGVNNYNEPLVVPTTGDAVGLNILYKDAAKRIPNKISGSLWFSKEGTLRRELSLHYYAENPLNMGSVYFATTGRGNDSPSIYGFVVCDKASSMKKMMVEVTGMGQVRRPYGVFPPSGKKWGENFDPTTETGS